MFHTGIIGPYPFYMWFCISQWDGGEEGGSNPVVRASVKRKMDKQLRFLLSKSLCASFIIFRTILGCELLEILAALV